MAPEMILAVHLILGYVAWLLCFKRLHIAEAKFDGAMAAERAIATVHSFRFLGWSLFFRGL